jgi:hypothetical protein
LIVGMRADLFERRVPAIDPYPTVADNLAAVAATLAALRLVERHGGTQVSTALSAAVSHCPRRVPCGTRRGGKGARRMQYLTDIDLAGERGCILSDCGSYRYRLWREWGHGRPTLAFLMLNPSTADHLVDDPTITRCTSRAIRGKFGRLEVANLFPLRATDPDELLTHAEPIGPRSAAGGTVTADGAIMDAIDHATMVICAWGSHPAAAERAAEVLHLVRMCDMRNKLFHLGLNKDGSPRHPLYIAASTRPKQMVFDGVS